jgi:hypothetical protein
MVWTAGCGIDDMTELFVTGTVAASQCRRASSAVVDD